MPSTKTVKANHFLNNVPLRQLIHTIQRKPVTHTALSKLVLRIFINIKPTVNRSDIPDKLS
jgi:hypothetical protein